MVCTSIWSSIDIDITFDWECATRSWYMVLAKLLVMEVSGCGSYISPPSSFSCPSKEAE